MRCGFAFLILSAALCPAGTISDVFNQPQNNCNYSPTPPYSNCDVIGNTGVFDIQQASVTVAGNGFMTITLFSNLGGVSAQNGQLALGSFNSGPGVTLIPGDLFFYAAADGSKVSSFVDPNVTDFADPQSNINPYLTYAVPLVSHNGLIAGDLYLVDTSSIETASQAIGSPNLDYRVNLPELFTSGTLEAAGNGVSVAAYGNGTNSAEYAVTLGLNGGGSFIGSGQVGILWSSADCGNDYIQGDISTGTPEPASWILLLSGAALIAAVIAARRLAS
jgi:hypothetical protein